MNTSTDILKNAISAMEIAIVDITSIDHFANAMNANFRVKALRKANERFDPDTYAEFLQTFARFVKTFSKIRRVVRSRKVAQSDANIDKAKIIDGNKISVGLHYDEKKGVLKERVFFFDFHDEHTVSAFEHPLEPLTSRV